MKKTFKIPLLSIEEVYGKDAIDNAWDDISYCAVQTENYPGEFSFSFELDHSHNNPHYHSLICAGFFGSDEAFEKVFKAIQNLGLQLIKQLTDKEKKLAEYMSKLSEEAFTAGWMQNLEYVLWSAIENGPTKYGRLYIDENHIATLKKLSNNISGWIYFNKDHGEQFISRENWLHKYQQNIKTFKA